MSNCYESQLCVFRLWQKLSLNSVIWKTVFQEKVSWLSVIYYEAVFNEQCILRCIFTVFPNLPIQELSERSNFILLNMLFILLALGSFSTVFGEEWKEKTDRDFVKVIHVN